MFKNLNYFLTIVEKNSSKKPHEENVGAEKNKLI